MEINLSNKIEYNVTVENVFVRLIVNKEKDDVSPDAAIPTLHSHLYTELFVCLSGEISIQTDAGIIRLFKGDAAIVPTSMPHYKIYTDNSEKWYSVGFSVVKRPGRSYSNLHKKLRYLYEKGETLIFRNVPELCERIAMLHTTLYKEGDCLPALELVCILSRLATENKKNYSDNAPQKRMPDIYRIAWLEDLISAHSHEPLTTSKVADMLHISSRQLSRIVKSRYGMTFHEILIKKRIDKATRLLVTTDRPVNKIIEEVGYSKSSLFYKDFSAQFGITPTEYRNKFSENDTKS